MMYRGVAFLSMVFIASAAFAASAPALHIAITGESVTVSNVPAKHAIVLFSVSRSSVRRAIAVRPDARVLRDVDGDGVIPFTPTGGIPVRSVWVAVDESSGATAAGAQPEFPLLVSAIGSDNLRKNVQGEIASLAISLPRLAMLLVTPGKGAWLFTGFDGEGTDRDGKADGKVLLSVEDARAIEGKDNAPKTVKKDDVIVAIDPGHLDVFIIQVGK